MTNEEAILICVNTELIRFEAKVGEFNRRIKDLLVKKNNLEAALNKDNPSTSTHHFDVV